MKRKKYAGILAEPTPKPGIFGPTDKAYDDLHDQKVAALFQHFEIEPPPSLSRQAGANTSPLRCLVEENAAWMTLALSLAYRHVPGFRPPAPPPPKFGRPRVRTVDDMTLVMVVALLNRRDGLSVRKATKKIAAAGIINGAPETLRSRYLDATVIGRRAGSGQHALLLELLQHWDLKIGKDNVIKCLEDGLEGVLDGRL